MSLVQYLQIIAVDNWDSLSYQEQKAYLDKHPTSKRRLTKFSPEKLKEHKAIINRTYVEHHKTQRGREYKDFLQRRVIIDDAPHHLRSSYYGWRAHVQHAIKNKEPIPRRVINDYNRREKTHDYSLKK